MAMPASGCIALRTCITGIACSSIACAVNGSAVGSCSLCALSVSAGKTAPHGMREFYGYAPATGSISLATTSTELFDGFIEFNTITASGAWSATKFDPDFIIDSFTSSGSGNGKITVAGSFAMPPFPSEAEITYCLTSSPTTRTTWFLYWSGY